MFEPPALTGSIIASWRGQSLNWNASPSMYSQLSGVPLVVKPETATLPLRAVAIPAKPTRRVTPGDVARKGHRGGQAGTRRDGYGDTSVLDDGGHGLAHLRPEGAGDHALRPVADVSDRIAADRPDAEPRIRGDHGCGGGRPLGDLGDDRTCGVYAENALQSHGDAGVSACGDRRLDRCCRENGGRPCRSKVACGRKR